MAIYEETFEDAKRTISENFSSNGSKPNLFAHVQIRFGKKYMIDYTETYMRPGIQVIEDLMHKLDDICTGVESEEEVSSAVELEEDITLHQAIIQRDPVKVRAIISRGDDIQAIDNDGDLAPESWSKFIERISCKKKLILTVLW